MNSNSIKGNYASIVDTNSPTRRPNAKNGTPICIGNCKTQLTASPVKRTEPSNQLTSDSSAHYGHPLSSIHYQTSSSTSRKTSDPHIVTSANNPSTSGLETQEYDIPWDKNMNLQSNTTRMSGIKQAMRNMNIPSQYIVEITDLQRETNPAVKKKKINNLADNLMLPNAPCYGKIPSTKPEKKGGLFTATTTFATNFFKKRKSAPQSPLSTPSDSPEPLKKNPQNGAPVLPSSGKKEPSTTVVPASSKLFPPTPTKSALQKSSFLHTSISSQSSSSENSVNQACETNEYETIPDPNSSIFSSTQEPTYAALSKKKANSGDDTSPPPLPPPLPPKTVWSHYHNKDIILHVDKPLPPRPLQAPPPQVSTATTTAVKPPRQDATHSQSTFLSQNPPESPSGKFRPLPPVPTTSPPDVRQDESSEKSIAKKIQLFHQ